MIPAVGPLASLFVVCLLLFVVLFLVTRKKKEGFVPSTKDLLLVAVLTFAINDKIYGVIPFNCSRSNSVIIAGFLLKNEGIPKSEEEIEEYVKQRYFVENKAVLKRLREQVNIGNVKVVDGKFVITPQGARVVRLFGWITDLYNTDNNFARD